MVLKIDIVNGVPEVPDEYLGRVFGNVLDQYDSPTYNICLYLLRNPEQRNKPEDFALTKENGVILAQTGVTGVQIDNLTIKGISTSGTSQTTMKFTIYQPGAADFIDQLNLARAYLENPFSVTPTLFMEIVFKGYEADPDDEDEGGAPADVAGPFRYKMDLTSFDLSIDATGTEYDMECVLVDSLGYSDKFFRIPKDIASKGPTITERAQSLEDALNKHHTDASNAEIPDQIEIDVSQLLSPPGNSTVSAGVGTSLDYISDESIISSADSDAEDSNRGLNEVVTATRDAVEARDREAENPTDSGNETEQILDQDVLNIPEDRTIHEYFLTLLSMCKEFNKKVTRREVFGDLESALKQDQPYVSWMRVLCEVEDIGFDKKRGIMARKIKYIPVLYKTVRTDLASTSDELIFSKSDAIARIRRTLESGMIYKSYNYIFSGQNDQVIDVDLDYNLGVAILGAPGGGTMGDSSTTNSTITTPRVDQTQDISPVAQENFVKAVRNLVEKNSLVNTLTNLGELFSGGLADSVSQLANDAAGFLGRAPGEVLNALTDVTGQSAQALLQELDNRTISQLNASLQITDPTASLLGDLGDPEVAPANPDGSEYTTESSGAQFASDLVDPQGTPDLEQLKDLGYLAYGDVDVDTALDLKPILETTIDRRTLTEAGTYSPLTPDNRLFGYLVEQSTANLFLIKLNLTIRGDPWYLGLRNLVQGSNSIAGANTDAPRLASLKTNERAIALERDDNCFWFTMRSPRTYDPDWRDEDSELNSGYWRFDGVNRSTSGLYRITTYECNFSRGVFTVEIQGAIREIPINRTGNQPIVENDYFGTPPISDELPGESDPGDI